MFYIEFIYVLDRFLYVLYKCFYVYIGVYMFYICFYKFHISFYKFHTGSYIRVCGFYIDYHIRVCGFYIDYHIRFLYVLFRLFHGIHPSKGGPLKGDMMLRPARYELTCKKMFLLLFWGVESDLKVKHDKKLFSVVEAGHSVYKQTIFFVLSRFPFCC